MQYVSGVGQALSPDGERLQIVKLCRCDIRFVYIVVILIGVAAVQLLRVGHCQALCRCKVSAQGVFGEINQAVGVEFCADVCAVVEQRLSQYFQKGMVITMCRCPNC